MVKTDMTDTERLVTFEILGQEYKFYTGASEEEMESILALVRPLVETGSANAVGTLPVGKIAVLACLNIASRYVKLQCEFDEYRQKSEQRLGRVNAEIRANLYSD